MISLNHKMMEYGHRCHLIFHQVIFIVQIMKTNLLIRTKRVQLGKVYAGKHIFQIDYFNSVKTNDYSLVF